MFTRTGAHRRRQSHDAARHDRRLPPARRVSHHSGKTLSDETLLAFEKVLAIGEGDAKSSKKRMSSTRPGESDEHEKVVERYGECREEWGPPQRVHHRKPDGRGSTRSRVQDNEEFDSLRPKAFQRRLADAHRARQAFADAAEPCCSSTSLPTTSTSKRGTGSKSFLANYPFAIVLVSHDRFFLDQVVTRITEIDRRKLVDYTGNYSNYLETRAAKTSGRAPRESVTATRRDRPKPAGSSRSSATRRAKPNRCRAAIKMLEKMEKIEVPPERKLMRLRLPEVERSGSGRSRARNVCKKSYGDNARSSKAPTSSSSAASAWRSWARTASGSRRSCGCSPFPKRPTTARSSSVTTSRRATSAKSATTSTKSAPSSRT